MSSPANPITASGKVNVAVKGALLVGGTLVIVTVGLVLSTSKVLSFAPVGAVSASALPTVSVMSWLFAKPSVTVAVRSSRLPPVTVTSYTVAAVTSLTDSDAVVPLTAKSAGSTFATFSLNVTRQIRLFALVGVDAGFWRSIESTRGGVDTIFVCTVAYGQNRPLKARTRYCRVPPGAPRWVRL